MKLELKRRKNISFVLFNTKIPFINKNIIFKTTLYNTPNAWVHGYSSRTQFGQYVLFHDYDNLDEEAIVQELEFLQDQYHLSDYYLFKLDRENSYHAVCLDTFPIAKAYNIQQATSCDLAFIHSIKNLHTKEWILRWYKKGERGSPEYVRTIKSPYNERVKSSAHANFLKKLCVPIKMFKRHEWDGGKVLAMVDYNTANRTT